MSRIKVTFDGANKVKAQIDELKNVVRPALSKQIGEAIEQGDLKENADYHSAKEKQAYVEEQISALEKKVSLFDIIDISSIPKDRVVFGTKLRVLDLDSEQEKVYQLLSEFETNKEKGIISSESPVGRAFLNHKVGDEIEVIIPAGTKSYEILEIL